MAKTATRTQKTEEVTRLQDISHLPRYVSVPECARQIGISPQAAHRLVQAGLIPSIAIPWLNGRLRFRVPKTYIDSVQQNKAVYAKTLVEPTEPLPPEICEKCKEGRMMLANAGEPKGNLICENCGWVDVRDGGEPNAHSGSC